MTGNQTAVHEQRQVSNRSEQYRPDLYLVRPAYPEYLTVTAAEEAVQALTRYGTAARLLAGGVDLNGLMKRKVLANSPLVLINLKNIAVLQQIRETRHGLSIGALTRINTLERSDLIRLKYPLLWEAASSIGSPQVRNMGTIAGNIMQDVRCWYYRRPPDTGVNYHCRRRIPEGICYAEDGENRYHSIFCGQACMAPCLSDLAVALTALDARINTTNEDGDRQISVPAIFTSLGKSLRQDEMITELWIPEPEAQTQQRFFKFRLRNAIDFAIVSVAAMLKTDDELVREARIVLGGVAYRPHRAVAAEDYLQGRRVTEKTAAEAAKIALAEATPSEKNAYKAQIAETLVKRAILNNNA